MPINVVAPIDRRSVSRTANSRMLKYVEVLLLCVCGEIGAAPRGAQQAQAKRQRHSISIQFLRDADIGHGLARRGEVAENGVISGVEGKPMLPVCFRSKVVWLTLRRR